MTATVRDRLQAGVETASRPLLHFVAIYALLIASWTVSVHLLALVGTMTSPGMPVLLIGGIVTTFGPALTLAATYEVVHR